MVKTLAGNTGCVEFIGAWVAELPVRVELIYLGVLLLLVTGERMRPKSIWRPRALKHSQRTNLQLLLFNSALMALCANNALWLLADRFDGSGLLGRIDNTVVKTAASVLLFDLLLYLWHAGSHRCDFLWRFHSIHHSDLCLNTTTAFRLHWLELFLVTCLKAVYLAVTGAGKTALLINETLTFIWVMYHHANIATPGEKWLNRLLVTPALHRVHHSTERWQHDRNYGAVFSIWDRLFGTLLQCEPQRIGIKGAAPQTFREMVTFGLPGVPIPSSEQAPSATGSITNLEADIAVAAYFKAERRGFESGYDLGDWLEAEREITLRHRAIAKTDQARQQAARHTPIVLSYR